MLWRRSFHFQVMFTEKSWLISVITVIHQQIYAPNLECKGVATASHNAKKPGRSCQKLSNNIVQSMQMNANHIQVSWIIMVLDTQIYLDPPRGAKSMAKGCHQTTPWISNTTPWRVLVYTYIIYIIYIYIFITSSWSSFSPMIDSFHLRNSSRSIHRQRRALATGARRWDIGSAGPTWLSPAFPATCNTIKIHWRRQKNRQRHTKFRDVFFSFKSSCHSFGVVLAS